MAEHKNRLQERYHSLVDLISGLELETSVHNELWKCIHNYANAYGRGFITERLKDMLDEVDI